MNINFLKSWYGDVLALGAGLLMPLAFAPYGFSLAALLSVILIMLCWAQISKARAFFRGWLYGLGMFGFGVSWVHISMNQFGGVSVPLSIALTTLFVMFLALYPAITGYLARRFADRGTHQLVREYIIIIPAVWVLFEWIKGWLFTGFPWMSVGYSQLGMPLQGFAPVFGVYGISYVLVLSAGVIVYWVLSGKSVTKFALPGLLVIWLSPVALNMVSWSEPDGEPIKISMVQGNVSQDVKWLPEQRIPTLKMYTELSREHWGSDLVIWPETAIPALYHQVQPFLKKIAQEARMNSSELLVGIPVYNQQSKQHFNSMMSLGLHESFYDKRHLVPFGEYLPLKDYLGGIIDFFDIPMSDFSPGEQELPILKVAGVPAGISICFEDVFGEEIIDALPDAKLLINSSNDAWFGDSLAAHQHLEIAQMRALETARYMVRSTNTGISAFINEKGRIQSASPQFEIHVLTDTVQPLTGMTPYAVFANIPVVLIASVVLGVGIWLGRQKKQSS